MTKATKTQGTSVEDQRKAGYRTTTTRGNPAQEQNDKPKGAFKATKQPSGTIRSQ
jgi:hypothetical protein